MPTPRGRQPVIYGPKSSGNVASLSDENAVFFRAWLQKQGDESYHCDFIGKLCRLSGYSCKLRNQTMQSAGSALTDSTKFKPNSCSLWRVYKLHIFALYAKYMLCRGLPADFYLCFARYKCSGPPEITVLPVTNLS